MWIDLNAEDSQEIIHHALDLERNPTEKKRTIIPVFDLYSREVGGDSSNDMVITFAYEIRWTPKNT